MDTCRVTGYILSPGGVPLRFATVRFEMTAIDKDHANQALVVPHSVVGYSDADGKISVDLWPNSKGFSGTRYLVSTTTGEGGALKHYPQFPAVVPEAAEAELVDISFLVAPASVDEAVQQVVLAKQARDQAKIYADNAKADAARTTADRVTTGQDKTSAAASASTARLAKEATAADRAATKLDAAATAADRVATAADRVATGQDKASTASDKISTAADRVATAADRAAAKISQEASKTSEENTKNSELAASADRKLTDANRIATAADREAIADAKTVTAADRAATSADRIAAARSAASASDSQIASSEDRAATEQDRLAAAESARTAKASEGEAKENATATAADRVATAADRVAISDAKDATAADRAATSADREAIQGAKEATASDRVATAADRAATNIDATATAADKVATAADRVKTGQDRTATAADKVATAADRVKTAEDRSAVAADKATTTADREATRLDREAAAASATSAASSAEQVEVHKTDLEAILANLDGGTSGQFLTKKSDGSYDYIWASLPVVGDMLKNTYDKNNNGKVDVAEVAESVAWDGVKDKPQFGSAALADASSFASSGKVSNLETAVGKKLDSVAAENTFEKKVDTWGFSEDFDNDQSRFLWIDLAGGKFRTSWDGIRNKLKAFFDGLYQPKGNYQPSGSYATQAAVDAKLPTSNGRATGLGVNGDFNQYSDGQTALWFRTASGAEKTVIWTTAAASNLNIRVNGKTSYVTTDGDIVAARDLKAPGWVYAGNGSANLQSNGNVVGSIWSNWGSSDAYTAVNNRIEQRARDWAVQEASNRAPWGFVTGSAGLTSHGQEWYNGTGATLIMLNSMTTTNTIGLRVWNTTTGEQAVNGGFIKVRPGESIRLERSGSGSYSWAGRYFGA